MSTEIYTPPVDLPQETLGLTLSEARTNYVVGAMSELAIVADAFSRIPEGNRISARLEMLPDPVSLERQYKGAIVGSILSLRENKELPKISPEDALRQEDKLRLEEVVTFAGIVGIKFGLRSRHRFKQTAHKVNPVKLGWGSHEISLHDAIEMRTILRLHEERKVLKKVF